MNESFYSKWEKQRKKKWLYILLHGPIYLGIPMGLLIYLLRNNFSVNDIHFFDLIYEILFGMFISFVIVLQEYKRKDKIYLEKENNDGGSIN